MNFEKEYLKYKDDIIKHTMNLINIPSVLEENEVKEGVTYRFGYYNKVALDYFLQLAEQLGFKTKNVENVCGHVEYGEGEEIFACLCHLDVVPADGNDGRWKRDPFQAWIENGNIYGRGSQDDKAPAVASLYALKVLKDIGFKPQRRIRLIVGTDEESGSRGLERYLELEEKPSLGISPDAEFPIIYAEKGISSFDITCTNASGIFATGGVRYNVVAPSVDVTYNNCNCDIMHFKGESAHAMEPNNGINAIKLFINEYIKHSDDRFLKFIYENLMDTRLKDMNLNICDEEMGPLTMNIGILEMKEICRLGINIRYPKNLNFESFFKSFKDKAKEYGLDVTLISNTPVHYIDPNSQLIQSLHKSYIKYTNDNTPLKTIGGGTYARDIPNAVAFGVAFPDDVEVAHEPNEYINIEKLLKAGVIITDAIYNVNK